MKKILVNLYNQKGAGPKNISRQFLIKIRNSDRFTCIINKSQADEFCKSKANFIIYKQHKLWPIRIVYYFYFYYLFLPYFVFRKGIDRYLVFGNYLHGFVPCRKRVLIHHPYLFDFNAIVNSSSKVFYIELCRYFIFRLLLIFRSKTTLVVQTRSMMNKIDKSLVKRFESKIIPNPISSDLIPQFRGVDNLYTAKTNKSSQPNFLRLGYISRYYPHKRFDLLLEFINAFRNYNIPFLISITVNEFPKEIERRLYDYPELVNHGEVLQSDLQRIYEELDLTLYFSDRETFGNTILESLMFGIPIFGLNHSYFLDFITDPNSKLISESVQQMAETINNTVRNHELMIALCMETKSYASDFLDVDMWVEEMCNF